MSGLPPKVELHPQFGELQQRTASPIAWLDEVLIEIEAKLIKIAKEENAEDKQWFVIELGAYVSGLITGNRFMRKSPYTEENPPLKRSY